MPIHEHPCSVEVVRPIETEDAELAGATQRIATAAGRSRPTATTCEGSSNGLRTSASRSCPPPDRTSNSSAARWSSGSWPPARSTEGCQRSAASIASHTSMAASPRNQPSTSVGPRSTRAGVLASTAPSSAGSCARPSAWTTSTPPCRCSSASTGCGWAKLVAPTSRIWASKEATGRCALGRAASQRSSRSCPERPAPLTWPSGNGRKVRSWSARTVSVSTVDRSPLGTLDRQALRDRNGPSPHAQGRRSSWRPSTPASRSETSSWRPATLLEDDDLFSGGANFDRHAGYAVVASVAGG